ncbi:MAG: GNAT family protein [Oscillospiraceae bacterium]|nr:GNAT family protein [Oscillospiraceae bacterium]
MNCKIRKWSLSDAHELAQILGNTNVQNNLRDGFPLPYTDNDAAEYIRSVLNDKERSVFAFAVTLDDKVVGSIGIFRKDNIHFRTAEMGYCLSEPYWGRGIASAAVKLACSLVFENSDIIRIFAEPFADNAASCRVLEKCGFEYEGTMKSNAVKNSQIIDMKLYALIKSN